MTPLGYPNTERMVNAYRDLLRSIGAIGTLAEDAPLTSHWPVVGGSYSQDLMVVGQAVFGWIPNWLPGALRSEAGVERILEMTSEPLTDRADPMSWIEENSSRRSPFWRTVELVAGHLSNCGPWYSGVTWANLYPIAPNSPPGNPSGELLRRQTNAAAQVLLATVDALQPRCVLVLAGPYWWPFEALVRLDAVADAQRPLLRTGRKGSASWIVGWHPAGASRRGWPPAMYSKLILSEID